MGPPTDPRPSGSARVLKWSVCPCYLWYMAKIMWTLLRCSQ
ncbi:unnamed protein product [Staurois parvus]|uniref:Uncharacterized protein n=1 Tax=Staurois parvus TaxID=386267 RepID=A0ABN9AX05_9NEOB|nr:unnamed protein product [Staurois parvus]